ncbi:MAG: SRPBCC family protein [Deltaproteobacteria bacterium]|nr:SRPBCC family protein [Deltaproteobacteria bacterium]
MPRGDRTIVVNVPPEHMFDVVADYERYPEFGSDILEARVEQRDDPVQIVFFAVKVVRRIEYTLRLVHDRPHRVDWTLVSGNMMRTNVGGWQFNPLSGARTEVRYFCEIGMGALVPRAVTMALVDINLPKMLGEFKARAERLYRKK